MAITTYNCLTNDGVKNIGVFKCDRIENGHYAYLIKAGNRTNWEFDNADELALGTYGYFDTGMTLICGNNSLFSTMTSHGFNCMMYTRLCFPNERTWLLSGDSDATYQHYIMNGEDIVISDTSFSIRAIGLVSNRIYIYIR